MRRLAGGLGCQAYPAFGTAAAASHVPIPLGQYQQALEVGILSETLHELVRRRDHLI